MRTKVDQGAETEASPALAVESDLSDCLFLDALDLDPRPTLVVDLNSTQSHPENALEHVFYNTALSSRPSLLDALHSNSGNTGLHQEFNAWIAASPQSEHYNESFTAPKVFGGLSWISFTLKNRWRVVSAISSHFGLEVLGDRLRISPDVSETAIIMMKNNNNGLNKTFDEPETVVRALSPSQLVRFSPGTPDNPLSPRRTTTTSTQCDRGSSRIIGSTWFISFIRNFDWASTPLGPICSWSDRLVQLCNLMLSDPNPACIHWTSDLIILYNEACLPTLAERHPSIMGQPSRDTYAELWESYFEPIYTGVMTTGSSLQQHNNCLSIEKNRILEEAFFTNTFLPVFGPDSQPEGILELFSDVTTQNLAQRRTRTLLELNTSLESATDLASLWKSIIQGVEGNPQDVPQLLIYAATPNSSFHADSLSQTTSARLDCVLKVFIGYTSSADTANLESFDALGDSNNLAQYFRKAMSSDTLVHLRKVTGNLPKLWNSFEPRAFGDPSYDMVILPIRQNQDIVAFILLGLNPRSQFDYAYADFVNLLHRHISSRVVSTLLHEMEARRRQTVAEQAAAQLRIHMDEAAAHELRFSRFAQHAPVGICIYGPDGSMIYANDLWYSMTNFSKDADSTGSSWWTNLIFPEDIPDATEMFTHLLLDHIPVRFEIRLKANSSITAPHTENQCIWVLCSAFPELSNGNLESVVACFTDINEQKRSEEIQKQRLEDAIESKRQQENFIDMTSHEIRNPLSVVLQCGEEIIDCCKETLERCTAAEGAIVLTEVVNNVLDAAETIEYCTLHQKRIIDDILTLSKMDSGLLPITPDTIQPLKVANNVLRAFKRELLMADIETKFHVDESFYQHERDWYELDPSRFSQMMINLISNAIKFTKTQARREITIRIGMSNSTTPPLSWPISYLPSTIQRKEWSLGPKFPNKKSVTLHLCVQDSGRGITSEEQKALFMRFSQASPRTHIQYGGSGLGLYICRSLAEMHGGQIGFSTQPKEGSTFGFYIKMWPSTSPHPTSAEGIIASLPVTNDATTTSPLPAHTKLHIMIVEDNLLNQKVLRRQLEKLGHIITVAHHGQEALDLLQKTHFWTQSAEKLPLSIILMDIEMPIMDGLELARSIRALQKDGEIRAHVPLIAVTGNARKEKTDLAIAAGVDEVVLKPFKIPSLMPIVERLCLRWNSYGER